MNIATEDFEIYLDILSSYKRQHGYLLYAYVLMGNHVHLLIETRERPLWKILQGINQRYTLYFNRKYRTVGHLFQGRYKAILCDRDEYLLSLVKYIHLNPVRAKSVARAGEYRWSSHNRYAGNAKTDIVDTDQVLRMFAEEKAKARGLYRRYVEGGPEVDRRSVYATVDQRILGDERFVEQVMKRAEGEVGAKRRARQYTLPAIAEAMEEARGIKLFEMRGKGKDHAVSAGRKIFSHVATEFGYRGKEIAVYLKKDPAIITRYLKERDTFRKETERVVEILRRTTNVNKQV